MMGVKPDADAPPEAKAAAAEVAPTPTPEVIGEPPGLLKDIEELPLPKRRGRPPTAKAEPKAVPQAVPNPQKGLSPPTKRLDPTPQASPSPSPDRKRNEQAEIDAQLK